MGLGTWLFYMGTVRLRERADVCLLLHTANYAVEIRHGKSWDTYLPLPGEGEGKTPLLCSVQ